MVLTSDAKVDAEAKDAPALLRQSIVDLTAAIFDRASGRPFDQTESLRQGAVHSGSLRVEGEVSSQVPTIISTLPPPMSMQSAVCPSTSTADRRRGKM